MGETFLFALLLLDATLRVATPLVLAAFAGMIAERSGVVDIGLEGKMLAAAFAAAAAAAVTGSAWLGLLAGMGASVFQSFGRDLPNRIVPWHEIAEEVIAVGVGNRFGQHLPRRVTQLDDSSGYRFE